MAKSWVAQAVNVFSNSERASTGVNFPGQSSGGRRPDRVRMIVGNERSLLASVYTRLAVDASSVMLRHCRVNEDDEFIEFLTTGLNNCLTLEANLDQNAQSLMLEIAMTTLDKGVAVIIPINAMKYQGTGEYADINTMRVGYVQEFKGKHVRVSVWNEDKNQRVDVTVLKKDVGIVENPYYAVMNEPNSTLQRLNKKLMLLDMTDNRVSSGKLDLLVKFPFQVRGDRKEADAARRIEILEQQLNNSQTGVAYIDATEQVVQLNRAVENKLLEQVKTLRLDLFSELGLTPEILNGTADGDAIQNYMSRTLEPILKAITLEMKRKFLTKTGRTQGQTVKYFPNVFRMIPLKDLAELGDKLIRNEVVTANEFRSFVGLRPSKDPKADQLYNPNVPQPLEEGVPTSLGATPPGQGVDPSTTIEPESTDPTDEADALSDDFEAEIDGLMQSNLENLVEVLGESLSHVYDPAKRKAYYEANKQLKGRKKGAANNDPRSSPTNKQRAASLGNKAASDLGPERAKAVKKLVDKSKEDLGKITDDFRDWIKKNPKATPKEQQAKREVALAQKDKIINGLKTDIGKITMAASERKKSPLRVTPI